MTESNVSATVEVDLDGLILACQAGPVTDNARIDFG
jgi:hypothetical protein